MADEAITGGRELDEMLRTLSVKVEKNILRSALRAGGVEFRKEAKAIVAVEDGDLARSIRVTTRTRKGTIYVSVKAGGKRAPHWHFVEFGTRPHRIMSQGEGGLRIGGSYVGAVDHPGARPFPFMRPTFDSKAQAALIAIAKQIRKRLTIEGLNVPAPEAE